MLNNLEGLCVTAVPSWLRNTQEPVGKKQPTGGCSKTEILVFTEEQVSPEGIFHIQKYECLLGF